MKAINMENVQEAGTQNSLKAGGYVCKIVNVEDVVDKQYLMIEFDIAEGPNKDYFKKFEERNNYWSWNAVTYRSYKEKALPMLKRFCSAVTKSNPGFIFDAGAQNSDEKTLKGKLIGLVLFEEEYVKNNGDIGTRLKVDYETDVEKIRKGDFKVKDKVCLPDSQVPATAKGTDFVNIPESCGQEEVPFN
jgi:hypothetical protein